MTEAEIEAAAQEVMGLFGQVRRRARPRTAPRLGEAAHAMIPTRAGAVASWRLGAGPAVLLVHGWEDDNSLWDTLIGALEAANLALVAIDLPAHGFSEGETISLQSAARALADVARAAAPIWAGVTHSFGGPALVTAMAEEGLKLDAVALVAAPVAQKEQWARMSERYGIPAPVAARARALLEAKSGVSIEAQDLRRFAPAMTAKALIAHAMDDEQCPLDMAMELAGLWPGAETLFTDGMGHRDIARDQGVAERIVEFLQKA
jgi:pimeloyl-ACP methyl ester carboxylesterase